jgi:Na+/H+ antiporter NhaA
MSTDTAFALGLLALVGPRFPDRLRAFMLTVVVVDDVVAVIVIATVYTETLHVVPLLVAIGLFGAMFVARRFRVPAGVAFATLGTAAWGRNAEVGDRACGRWSGARALDVCLSAPAVKARTGDGAGP